jgi:hypothetical protein
MDYLVKYVCYHDGKFCSNGYVYFLGLNEAIATIAKWNRDGNKRWVYAIVDCEQMPKPEYKEYKHGYDVG